MKFHQILSLALSCILLAGVLPVLPVSAEATADAAPEPAWVDLSDIADGGSYTASDGTTYTVLKSPQTVVATVKANMSGRYILGADLDMGGAQYAFPMFGNDPFEGILNGNGHSITNFSIASSVNANNGLLFHSLGGSPKILDLTVGSADAHISMTLSKGKGESIGGIAGAMKNTDARTLLSGVTVYSDILYTDVRDNTVMIGGMIGKAAPCTIRACSFYGSVKFADSAKIEGKNTMVGGMVGRHNVAEGTLRILNCRNYADIDITARVRGTYVRESAGGMLGSAEYPIMISGCTNAGAMNSDHQSGGMVGGIKGGKLTEHSFVIENCENTGAITSSVFAGGIIGEVQSGGGASDSLFAVTVSRSCNRADVKVSTTDESLLSDGNCAAGGIIGRGKFGYYSLQNCYSVGDISCPGKSGAHSATASGIVGFLYVNSDEKRLSSIQNCFAMGSLTFASSLHVGNGICTASSNSASKGYLAEIVNCYYCLTSNAGAVTAACNMTLSESSANYGSKSAAEMASGAVAELLGDEFEQIAGTDAHPVLKPAEPDEEEPKGRENLFSGSVSNGYYNEKGQFRAESGYKTLNLLAVSVGNLLTVGAFCNDQTSFGHLYDGAKASRGVLTLEQMTKVGDLGSGYGIYSYTVPDGVAFVSITVPARRAYLTLVTLNDQFDPAGYYEFFGIPEMTGASTSPLWRKRALFAGDSISFGYSDTAVNGVARAWAGRISYDYDMEYVNVSVSGATLTNRTQNRVISQLTPYLGENFDYIVLEGGINDANPNYCNAPVGTVSDSKEAGSFDASTYAGALEELFCTVRNSFPDAAVGFIITYRVPRIPDISNNYKIYLQVTKEICEKWNVDALNLYENEEINQTVLATSSDAFLKDGIHPNGSAYDRLSPYIAKFMETLEPSSGGSGEDPEPPSSGEEPVNPPTPGGEEESREDPVTSSGEDTTKPDAPATGSATGEPEKSGCASSFGFHPFALLAMLGGILLIFLKKRRTAG